MDFVNLGFVAYFVGIVLSVMYPYLTTYLETGESFEWRYVWSRLIAAIIAGGIAVVSPGFVEWLQTTASGYEYPALYFLAVMFTTFGVGQFGRTTQRLGIAVSDKIRNE